VGGGVAVLAAQHAGARTEDMADDADLRAEPVQRGEAVRGGSRDESRAPACTRASASMRTR
jgi:hypothetical protein